MPPAIQTNATMSSSVILISISLSPDCKAFCTVIGVVICSGISTMIGLYAASAEASAFSFSDPGTTCVPACASLSVIN